MFDHEDMRGFGPIDARPIFRFDSRGVEAFMPPLIDMRSAQPLLE
jgi:hypothetical protein